MTECVSRIRAAVVLASVSIGLFAMPACGSQDEGKDPNAALPTAGKWDCAEDGDCMNSCKMGAVSKAWYDGQAGTLVECDDGCNNQISGPPRCIDGGCVAFDNKGARRDYCTRKDASK